MSIAAGFIKQLLDTIRYPPDKILDTYTGSFTAAAGVSAFLPVRTESSVPHTYGKAVLLNMTYSMDGGATWQDSGTAVPDLTTPSAPIFDTTYVGCYCTSSNIVLTATNFITSSKSITYKVVAMSLT
jgi:hypothetical protein